MMSVSRDLSPDSPNEPQRTYRVSDQSTNEMELHGTRMSNQYDSLRAAVAEMINSQKAKRSNSSSPATPPHSSHHVEESDEDIQPLAPGRESSFDRVVIAGSDPRESLDDERSGVCRLLIKALQIRNSYMKASKQSISVAVKNAFSQDHHVKCSNKNCSFEEPPHWPKPGFEPWNIFLSEPANYYIAQEYGVFNVYKSKKDADRNMGVQFIYPTWATFVSDIIELKEITANGPAGSYSFKRLSYLISKFQIHILLNEKKETTSQKNVPHRDFYNIRKVDNSVQGCLCMNKKHLLRFIKKKIREKSNDVISMKGGTTVTLDEFFQSMNLTSYDLSVDMLSAHPPLTQFAKSQIQIKPDPLGNSQLTELFLNTDNEIHGQYLATLIKEVFHELEESKYQSIEMKLPIYGKDPEEWDRLANWAIRFDVYSHNARWIIQLSNTYLELFTKGKVKTFQEYLYHIFGPLFEATNDPDSRPELFKFLFYVVGFDFSDSSVHDHKKVELLVPPPDEWNEAVDPPYHYYVYYIFANMTVLNLFREKRRLPTFAYRPHCHENGAGEHLLCSYIMAESISGGLALRRFPTIQYIYYLAQVGISMSPLSSNIFFKNYSRNPFPEFFAKGLNVSLCTDRPLIFHITREPLMEEYSIATQVWKLTACDMCELAKNSVLISGFPLEAKKYWLSDNFDNEGVEGNDITKTNLPNIRVLYRQETWTDELGAIFQGLRY